MVFKNIEIELTLDIVFVVFGNLTITDKNDNNGGHSVLKDFTGARCLIDVIVNSTFFFNNNYMYDIKANA